MAALDAGPDQVGVADLDPAAGEPMAELRPRRPPHGLLERAEPEDGRLRGRVAEAPTRAEAERERDAEGGEEDRRRWFIIVILRMGRHCIESRRQRARPGARPTAFPARSAGLPLGVVAVPEAELAAGGDEAVAVAAGLERDEALVEVAGDARLLEAAGRRRPSRR